MRPDDFRDAVQWRIMLRGLAGQLLLLVMGRTTNALCKHKKPAPCANRMRVALHYCWTDLYPNA